MEDEQERLELLLKAYEIACRQKDFLNVTLISSSLADLYITEIGNLDKGTDWLTCLKSALKDYWDSEEHKRLTELKKKFTVIS